MAINETVRFGALEVTPRACYSRPPTEAPATDGFIEVDELTLQGEIKRIFSGWMFAASPGLNAVEHPIYDVWLTDCKGAPQPTVAEAPPAPAPAPARTQQRTPQQQQLQQLQQQQRRSTQLPPPPPPRGNLCLSADRRLRVLQCLHPVMVRRSAVKSASPTSAASSSL